MTYEEWLVFVQNERDERGWSLSELGDRAAVAAGRQHAYHASSIQRLLAGTSRAPELVTAVALVVGRAPGENTVLDDADAQQWLTVGLRLRAVAPVLFGRILERVERLLDEVERVK